MNLIFLVTIFLAGFVDGVVNVTYRDENFKTKHLNATIHTISLKPNEGTAINTKTAKSRLPRKYLRHSKSRDRKTFSTARKFMNRQLSNSCRYANDGECDEPSLCAHGTDETDCEAFIERVSSTTTDSTGCWEAYLPNFSCAGYESAGYTCVGNWCAALNPRGTPSRCANKKGTNYVVDQATGRCTLSSTNDASSSYTCTSQHGCLWSYSVDGAWGYLSQTRMSLSACQLLCDANSICVGIELTSSYCAYWKANTCSPSHSSWQSVASSAMELTTCFTSTSPTTSDETLCSSGCVDCNSNGDCEMCSTDYYKSALRCHIKKSDGGICSTNNQCSSNICGGTNCCKTNVQSSGCTECDSNGDCKPTNTQRENCFVIGRVDKVYDGSPAASAGLQYGDMLVKFGNVFASSSTYAQGKDIHCPDWRQWMTDVVNELRKNNRVVSSEVMRGKNLIEMDLVPKSYNGPGKIGIVLTVPQKKKYTQEYLSDMYSSYLDDGAVKTAVEPDDNENDGGSYNDVNDDNGSDDNGYIYDDDGDDDNGNDDDGEGLTTFIAIIGFCLFLFFLVKWCNLPDQPSVSPTTSSPKSSRRKRLNQGSTKTLYHQTSRNVAKKIIKSQTMKRGSGGIVGGGIYFAVSSADTDRKAHNNGVILKCKVRLGKIKKVTTSSNSDSDITHTSLSNSGHDSVLVTYTTGNEHVVYNWDQVHTIRYHSCNDGGGPIVRTTGASAKVSSKNKSDGECPRGHTLSQFTTRSASFYCDKCSGRFKMGTSMYGCRSCNYDLCKSCY